MTGVVAETIFNERIRYHVAGDNEFDLFVFDDGDEEPAPINYKQGLDLATMLLQVYGRANEPVPYTVANTIIMALATSISLSADSFMVAAGKEEARPINKSGGVMVYFYLAPDIAKRAADDGERVFNLIPKIFSVDLVLKQERQLMSRDTLETLQATKMRQPKPYEFILFRFEYNYHGIHCVVRDMLVDTTGCEELRKRHGIYNKNIPILEVTETCSFGRCGVKTPEKDCIRCKGCEDVSYCCLAHKNAHARLHAPRCAKKEKNKKKK